MSKAIGNQPKYSPGDIVTTSTKYHSSISEIISKIEFIAWHTLESKWQYYLCGRITNAFNEEDLMLYKRP